MTRIRPRWWRELLLIGGTYGLYTLTRNTLPAGWREARANALDLYRVERWLHLDVEHAMNAFVAGRHVIAVAADYTYSAAHLPVTLVVLGWVYAVHPAAYRRARTVLLVTTVVALVGFWLFPLAPPRLLPHLGFVDTVVRDGTWGSWGSGPVTAVSNQYAAMPSIHVAWSLWSAGAVALLSRHRWARAAAMGYPVVVLLAVLGTANHWLLDVAGGLAALGVGVCVSAVARWAARRARRAKGRDNHLPARHRPGRRRRAAARCVPRRCHAVPLGRRTPRDRDRGDPPVRSPLSAAPGRDRRHGRRRLRRRRGALRRPGRVGRPEASGER